MPSLGMIAADREEDVNYFERLPDDVIIDIFIRVNDCRFLTQCLLVSKRIASLIRIVSSIKIHVPRMKKYHFYELNSCDCKIFIGTSQYSHQFPNCGRRFGIDSSFFIRKARQELHSFSEIKTAIVEFPYSFLFSFWDPKMVRWMMEYSGGGGGGGGLIKSCALLRSVMTPLPIWPIPFAHFISDLFVSAFTFYPLVAQMVQDHQSLRDILVTTKHSRKGWIHVGDDEIVRMRQADGVTSTDKLMKTLRGEGTNITMKVKMWYSDTVLNLPGDGSSFYAFVVVSSPDNIDHEVKVATSRFWGDWEAHPNDKKINMRELVETMPCNLEFTWITNYKA